MKTGTLLSAVLLVAMGLSGCGGPNSAEAVASGDAFQKDGKLPRSRHRVSARRPGR